MKLFQGSWLFREVYHSELVLLARLRHLKFLSLYFYTVTPLSCVEYTRKLTFSRCKTSPHSHVILVQLKRDPSPIRQDQPSTTSTTAWHYTKAEHCTVAKGVWQLLRAVFCSTVQQYFNQTAPLQYNQRYYVSYLYLKIYKLICL